MACFIRSSYTGNGGNKNACPVKCNEHFYDGPLSMCEKCSGLLTCSNGAGDCVVSGNSFACKCKPGFSGDRCENCDVQVHCSNHADTCQAGEDSFAECLVSSEIITDPQCPSGAEVLARRWTPKRCTKRDWMGRDKGSCATPGTAGTWNWQKPSITNQCKYYSNRYTCTSSILQVKCKRSTAAGCHSGFHDIKCSKCSSEFFCNGGGSSASHGGMCAVAQDGSPKCTCNEGFTGVDCGQCAPNYYPPGVCTTYCTREKTCNGFGSCGTAGQCTCDKMTDADGVSQPARISSQPASQPNDCGLPPPDGIKIRGIKCPASLPLVVARKWGNHVCRGDCHDCSTNDKRSDGWWTVDEVPNCKYETGKTYRFLKGNKCWVSARGSLAAPL